MTEGKRNIIRQFLPKYHIQSAEDIREFLKNLLGGTMKERWNQRWKSIWDMKNQDILTVMITTAAIN